MARLAVTHYDDQHQFQTLGCEAFRQPEADPARGAGDNRDSSPEFLHGQPVPSDRDE